MKMHPIRLTLLIGLLAGCHTATDTLQQQEDQSFSGCRADLIGKTKPLSPDSYGEFVTGDRFCYATKVVTPAGLPPGDLAEREIIFLHGDAFLDSGRDATGSFEAVIRETLFGTGFHSSKTRLRFVARLSNSISGVGKSTGIGAATTSKYGTDSYTKHAVRGFAGLIHELNRRRTAKSYSVIGFSGGGQIALTAVAQHPELMPTTLTKLDIISTWCDTDLIKTRTGWHFENAINPAYLLDDIPQSIEVDFTVSDRDRHYMRDGMRSCFDTLLTLGHTKSDFHVIHGLHHTATLSPPTFQMPDNKLEDQLR